MPPPFGCPKEMVHMCGVGLRFSNLKIRQKILLFGIVSIIMLCIVFALFYGMVVSHMVLNRAEEDMKGELDEITDFFDEMDLDISYRLRHLDTSITIQQLLTAAGQGQKTDEDWSADALLEDICIAEQIYSVSLYTMDGRFVTGNDPETNRGLHLSHAVREAVGETEGNLWQDDAVYSRAHTDRLAVYRLIRTEKDAPPIGIARAVVSRSALSSVYGYIGRSGWSDLYIFSLKGNLVLPVEADVSVLQPARAAFNEDIEDYQPEREQRIYTGRGERYVVCTRFLEEYGLDVVNIVSYKRIMQEVQLMQGTLLALAVICVIVYGILLSVMGGSLSRPVLALSAKMHEVGSGQLDLRCNSTSQDEIGELSRSFDWMLDQIQDLMAENAASEKKRHELELISLQNQVTPHFLYNSLDGISALVQMGENKEAFQMSRALSRFYRGVLSDGRCVIRVSEELQMIESYLQVQSQRSQDSFDYLVDVDPALLDASIVKLTLQPLVENAIYHGIRAVRRRCLLTVTGHAEENGDMVLSIRDTGKGLDTAAENADVSGQWEKGDLILHRKGYGMYNADQRIKLYFGARYGLRVSSVPGEWTQADVHLPVYSYKEYQNDLSPDRR